MLSGSELVFAGLAAAAAGLVNAIAGGGTLISFPTLVALGVPDIVANITNTVALCPGYIGGAFAQREDLAGQKKRLIMLIPAGIIGGLFGGILLLYINEKTFHLLVPFLILIGAALLAIQDRSGTGSACIPDTTAPMEKAAGTLLSRSALQQFTGDISGRVFP